jgi:hypothetical protein
MDWHSFFEVGVRTNRFEIVLLPPFGVSGGVYEPFHPFLLNFFRILKEEFNLVDSFLHPPGQY